MDDKIQFMRCAVKEAMRAYKKEEIPVGAVVVCKGEIVARAHNKNRKKKNPLLHAEIIAISKAGKKIKSERLTECDLYVTKEPCAMCSGAIVNARIKRVIIAAEDEKYGACGTVLSVCGNQSLNHVPEIEFGLLRDEASSLLKDFFKKLREEKNK